MNIEKSIKYYLPKSKLSSIFWKDDMKMKSNIREKLLDIAYAFIDYL